MLIHYVLTGGHSLRIPRQNCTWSGRCSVRLGQLELGSLSGWLTHTHKNLRAFHSPFSITSFPWQFQCQRCCQVAFEDVRKAVKLKSLNRGYRTPDPSPTRDADADKEIPGVLCKACWDESDVFGGDNKCLRLRVSAFIATIENDQ